MYSRKLVATDKVPEGKCDCVSLRYKEAKIRKDLEDGIDAVGKKIALNTVIEDDRKPRVPLTEEQEEKLLSFVESERTYRKYYDDIILHLKTGLRI